MVTCCCMALASCSSAPVAANTDTYGALPTWLSSQAMPPDSVLTGTTDHPALTTEGDSVLVQLANASVLTTVAGPEVPGEGLPKVTEATTCTWTVTMSGASAAVPITVADFTARDHLGHVYPMSLVPGQPVPPATIVPGQSVTFELRAVMQTGEGLMSWAPGGKQPVGSWDFVVEND
jgi:hypothetical protein